MMSDHYTNDNVFRWSDHPPREVAERMRQVEDRRNGIHWGIPMLNNRLRQADGDNDHTNYLVLI